MASFTTRGRVSALIKFSPKIPETLKGGKLERIGKIILLKCIRLICLIIFTLKRKKYLLNIFSSYMTLSSVHNKNYLRYKENLKIL